MEGSFKGRGNHSRNYNYPTQGLGIEPQASKVEGEFVTGIATSETMAYTEFYNGLRL